MRYYPINLDVKERRCVVIGGGQVATRKVHNLLRCGAVVTVISPDATQSLQELARAGRIEWKAKPYESDDMGEEVFLVFGTTDNREVNSKVQEDARRIKALCNIADDPETCDFTLPAIVTQGDLTITISTSGKSPALSKRLRTELENHYGPEYAECLKIMGSLRERLLQSGHDPDTHAHLFRLALNKGLVEMIRDCDTDAVNKMLEEVFGGFL
jgi:precorrin-2 dehydrogenase/sirohydrochlorin ferrochelatase